MLQKNIIKLTNTKGEIDFITSYSDVSITLSSSDPVKSVSVSAEFISNKEVMRKHTIGSTLEIFNHPKEKPQEIKQLFYGTVSTVPAVLDGVKKNIGFSAKCLLGKTQSILINEVFEQRSITDILYSLMEYQNVFDEIEIPNIPVIASFSFKDEYLYSAIQKVCEVVSYTFEADIKKFRVFFDVPTESAVVVKKGLFEKGSASFTTDQESLVNHLRVYGGNELSKDFTEETFVGNGSATDFYVKYMPSESTVYVDDVIRKIGISGIHDGNSGFDVFMDYDQKLFQFPNPIPSGQKVRIKYKYYQKIVVEESDQTSIEQYGLFMEKKEMKSLTDRNLIRQYARDFIAKHKQPILSGSITPLYDYWNIRELIHIDIPDLLIDTKLVCTQKRISLSPGQKKIDLSFEEEVDLVDVLRSNIERIRELEKEVGNSDLEAIDRYRSVYEKVEMIDVFTFTKNSSPSFKIGQSKLGDVI